MLTRVADSGSLPDMGKSITPKYATTMDCNGIRASEACWRGPPTERALRLYLVVYNESLKPGGINEHISNKLGGYDKCRAVHGTIIRNNGSREIVAEVTL